MWRGQHLIEMASSGVQANVALPEGGIGCRQEGAEVAAIPILLLTPHLRS